MIATLNNDCSILTLNADALVSASGKTFDSLTLITKLNCSTVESSVDISSLIGSIANSSISIPSTLYYGDETKTTYCDGIYNFELQVVYTTGLGTFLVKNILCTLIGCTLKCKVLDYYIKTEDKNIYYKYFALLQNCDSCSCAKMCALYNEITSVLNDDNTVTTNTGCGCS